MRWIFYSLLARGNAALKTALHTWPDPQVLTPLTSYCQGLRDTRGGSTTPKPHKQRQMANYIPHKWRRPPKSAGRDLNP